MENSVLVSTMLINEAIEAGATRSTIEPQNYRVCGWIRLRLHKVIIQGPPMTCIHCHIPCIVLGGKRVDKTRDGGDESMLRSSMSLLHSSRRQEEEAQCKSGKGDEEG